MLAELLYALRCKRQSIFRDNDTMLASFKRDRGNIRARYHWLNQAIVFTCFFKTVWLISTILSSILVSPYDETPRDL